MVGFQGKGLEFNPEPYIMVHQVPTGSHRDSVSEWRGGLQRLEPWCSNETLLLYARMYECRQLTIKLLAVLLRKLCHATMKQYLLLAPQHVTSVHALATG